MSRVEFDSDGWARQTIKRWDLDRFTRGLLRAIVENNIISDFPGDLMIGGESGEIIYLKEVGIKTFIELWFRDMEDYYEKRFPRPKWLREKDGD